MPKMFSDLLLDAGIHPADVKLLRHQTMRAGKPTPYQLWRANRFDFEQRYQRTQNSRPSERTKFNVPYWASFVVNEQHETVFVGLFRIKLEGPVPKNWDDPISGVRPASEKGVIYDLYSCDSVPSFAPYSGELVIEWDTKERRTARTWVQRADRQEKQILRMPSQTDSSFDVRSPADVREIERRWSSYDPERRERVSQSIERGPVGAQVKLKRGGRCQICEALGSDGVAFRKRDGNPYSEAHHVWPVSTLRRGALAPENVMVLCANHHREVHYGEFSVTSEQRDHWAISIAGRDLKIEKTRLE